MTADRRVLVGTVRDRAEHNPTVHDRRVLDRALLARADWEPRATAHRERAEALTRAHRERRARHEKHPVEDFLWTYYSVKPSELARWHPGTAMLADAAHEDRARWRYYARVDPTTALGVDLESFFAKRGSTVDYVENLFTRTMEHTPKFGCFGLHEWAMVYRMTPEQIRHTQLSLRIGHDATDRVVEEHQIGCTHFDAFRFFTPEAAPLNSLQPTRETQPDLEQSGCLHAGMDLYKWTSKLGPIIPGEVLLDTFELARDIREVDMQASPYDVSMFTGTRGQQLTAIPIETAEGKREYARRQRVFASRGDRLRHRVLAAIRTAREALN